MLKILVHGRISWRKFDEIIFLDLAASWGFVFNLMDDLFDCICHFSHNELPVAVLISHCLFPSAI